VSASQKAVIQSGIDHWQQNSCLRFDEGASLSRHHIRFRVDKEGCWSLIGLTMGVATIQSVIQGGIVQDLVQGEFLYQDINLQDPGCIHVRVGTSASPRSPSQHYGTSMLVLAHYDLDDDDYLQELPKTASRNSIKTLHASS
ncbi:zinc metalloproteinase nas-34-like, partial [Tropilaelaps mercedesae]